MVPNLCPCTRPPNSPLDVTQQHPTGTSLIRPCPLGSLFHSHPQAHLYCLGFSVANNRILAGWLKHKGNLVTSEMQLRIELFGVLRMSKELSIREQCPEPQQRIIQRGKCCPKPGVLLTQAPHAAAFLTLLRSCRRTWAVCQQSIFSHLWGAG